jgi:hypothetical protein
MAERDWRNQKKTPAGNAPHMTLRIAAERQDRIRKIAKKNNTTVTAIINEGLDLFFDKYDAPKTPKPAALFD